MIDTAVQEHDPAPNGARLEVIILIDGDKWDDLIAKGHTDEELQKSIEKAVTFNKTISGVIATPPIFDISSASLQKYY